MKKTVTGKAEPAGQLPINWAVPVNMTEEVYPQCKLAGKTLFTPPYWPVEPTFLFHAVNYSLAVFFS